MQVGDAGRALVWFGATAFLLSLVAWALAHKFPRLENIARHAFTAGCISLFGVLISLAALFVGDQYQYEYIFGHSDVRNALAYKIAAVWSGQQGSFLLWACTSAVFGLFAAPKTGSYRRWFTISYALFLGCLCAILAYESPFVVPLIDGKILRPPDGAGLTASLQNYWVIIHPPTIFLGFGSLTVLGCWAFAALSTKNYKDWANPARPWAILSAAILGLGLCMGGLWAYETLGWGGFWAWDPVENTSFVPWCFMIALIHGLIVQGTRKKWEITNLLLGGLPFLSFVYGTYLTRSGVLGDSSKHSFATMNRVALWFLVAYGGIALFSFVGLWVKRVIESRKLRSAEQSTPLSQINRESFYMTGITLIIIIAMTAGAGMSFPFFTGLTGKPRIVDAPMYDRIAVWAYIPVMAIMAATPFISWRGIGARELWGRLFNVVSISIALSGTVLLLFNVPSLGMKPLPGATVDFPFNKVFPLGIWMAVLMFFSFFAIVANLWRIIETWKRGRGSWGAFVSHVGLGILMSGLIISRGFEQSTPKNLFLQQGDVVQALGSTVTYKGSEGDLLDRDNKLLFEVQGPSGTFTAKPGFYLIPSRDGSIQQMTWPFILNHPTYDWYFTLLGIETDVAGPITLKPGESKSVPPFTITYQKMTTEGQPGKVGTKFGAQLKVDAGDVTLPATPKMVVGSDPEPAQIGSEYYATLQSIDVGSKSVTVQLHYSRPLMFIEVFYKPWTIFVWLGTGILFLGGILAMVQRSLTNRAAKRTGGEPLMAGLEIPAETAKDDALAATP